MGGGQAGNGDPKGRAGNVVEAQLVAQGNACRVSPMLTANADLQIGMILTTQLYGHFHQPSQSKAIDGGKGVLGKDALCHQLGFDYVSCSPFRVPIARLAAAHAVLDS